MNKNCFFVILVITFFLYISILAPSCNTDKLEPIEPAEFCDTLIVSYNLQVRDIIMTNCAYSGCHVNGFASGDFSTYEGMLSRLENGLIQSRSVNLLDMPPPPDALTPEDIEILSCWFSKGYPKE